MTSPSTQLASFETSVWAAPVGVHTPRPSPHRQIASSHVVPCSAPFIDGDLPLLLDVDVVMVGFEPSKTVAALLSPDVHGLSKGAVDGILGAEENVRLLRDLEDNGAIFGAAAGLVRSAALARLRPGKVLPDGLLALGARGPAFGPGQGTELIGFLARVLEQCLHRLAEPPD